MNDGKDQPIDLSSLDPTRDPERFNALVGRVMVEAASRLEARRSANNVVGELVRWRTPVLTAAAAATAFLVFSLNSAPTAGSSTETAYGIAEAIGVPTEYAAWIRDDEQPTIADIYEGLEIQ